MTRILLGFVGDLLINREQPREVFREVGEVLRGPALLFGNLEGAYTDDPRPGPGTVGGCSGPVNNLDAYAEAGFGVMSLANNHMLDVGYAAMLENRARLREHAVQTCGAGEGLADARAPAIVERDGYCVALMSQDGAGRGERGS